MVKNIKYTLKLYPFQIHTFKIDNFNIKEVVSALKKLDVNSSSVGIETIIFNKFADSLCPLLTDLFNLCLDKSKIPDEWKIAHVTHIF